MARGNPNPVSRLGRPNKFSKDIKKAVLEAFEAGGGTKWLQRQMAENPVAYIGLLAKILPTQLLAEIQVTTKTVEINFLGLGNSPPQSLTLDPLLLEANNDEHA
jgi:hypothetical protein